LNSLLSANSANFLSLVAGLDIICGSFSKALILPRLVPIVSGAGLTNPILFISILSRCAVSLSKVALGVVGLYGPTWYSSSSCSSPCGSSSRSLYLSLSSCNDAISLSLSSPVNGCNISRVL